MQTHFVRITNSYQLGTMLTGTCKCISWVAQNIVLSIYVQLGPIKEIILLLI